MQLLKDKPLSIEELLKVVPISKDIKDEILAGYDSWDVGRRAATTEMLWDAFATFRDQIQDVAYQTLLEYKYGDDQYDGNMNLWAEAEDLTWQHIAELIAGKAESDQAIEKLRQELSAMHTA